MVIFFLTILAIFVIAVDIGISILRQTLAALNGREDARITKRERPSGVFAARDDFVIGMEAIFYTW